jgi:pyruvate dehydrogenase E2 component (dihydrolipoamide acetyltransferase)
MAYQLLLPDIGEGVVEAEILRWFVQPGDAVAEDQPLVEVMTDKATVTIPSPRRGTVLRLMWKVGDVARVHEPLAELELEAVAVAARGPPADQGPGAPATSPVRAAIAAAAGAASELATGETARAAGGAAGGAEPQRPRRSLAAPAVRALARELGIDLDAVAGTGPGGRVTKEDLRARSRVDGRPPPGSPASAATGAPATAASAGTASAAPPATGASGGAARAPRAPEGTVVKTPHGDVEVVPVRGLRRRIAEKMARAKRTAAHFTFVEQVDATELVRVKERMGMGAAAEGVKVTFLPFVVKAAVAALRRFPELNAAFDEEKGEIHRKRWYDIGVATATDEGLAVPVLRRADQRSILDLAREIERLSADARAGRLRPEDVGGSTFTITSLGALGGLFATPVLNHPEVGILGIHRIRPAPVVREGAVVVRDVMHVSVTSDHRVVDGHQAAAFAYEVIRYLEDPNLLFMQMV